MKVYRIVAIPSLKFTETYQECNVLRLEIPCSNFSYVKDAHFNIWSGEKNYTQASKTLNCILDLEYTNEEDIEKLKSQVTDVAMEIADLLIQANKKELKELNGMLVFAYDKKGMEVGFGRSVARITIPPQQKITINGETYYELNEVVDKMLGAEKK